MNRRERETLNRYLQEEEWGGHATTIYSETFYQKHIHNNIQYNEDEYIQENQEDDKIETKNNSLNIK